MEIYNVTNLFKLDFGHNLWIEIVFWTYFDKKYFLKKIENSFQYIQNEPVNVLRKLDAHTHSISGKFIV